MELPPPVNPDTNGIADQAKFGYAVGTELLSAVQYRLIELAGTGRLDPGESIRLQRVLIDVSAVLYAGTVAAIRDEDAYEGDNTYSDGRPVKTSVRIEPIKALRDDEFMPSDCCFTLSQQQGVVTYIAPVLGKDIVYGSGFVDVERGEDDASQPDYREYEDMLERGLRLEEGEISFHPRGPEH